MSKAPIRLVGSLSIVLALALIGEAAVGGPSGPDPAAAGRRLYREGRSVSGEAVNALVQGDVPVSGTQVTCQSCHGRSGFGVVESGRISAPVAAPFLFSPDAARRRPAYDEASLARALRDGVDPAGRPLDPLMPRFQLGDSDVAALNAYLRRLGAEPSPGVGPENLRLATVIAGDVARDVESAVLDVLEAYVADRNRSGRQRLRGGHAPGQPKEKYRSWTLDVWRLAGPAEGWRAQLETRYRESAPFALVGGVAAGSWRPIHEFCEAEEIPCLLPDTDLPPAGDGGYYSYYFSRGLFLEAAIIASTLAAEGLEANVTVVVEEDRASPSREAAGALARAVERRGGRVRTLEASGEPRPKAALAEALGSDASTIVLWLRAEAVRRLGPDILGSGAAPVFLSSTLLGGKWDDLPAPLRRRAWVVHLTALPAEPDPALERFRGWAKGRGVRIREERHQALAYFACLAFADGAKHLDRYIYRDYFMDLLEHASSLCAFLPLYRRSGITPGQRVLSRGGWVVDLSGRREPTWVVP